MQALSDQLIAERQQAAIEIDELRRLVGIGQEQGAEARAVAEEMQVLWFSVYCFICA